MGHRSHQWANAYDFSEDALWLRLRITHDQYLRTHGPTQRSPYTKLRSWTIYRNRDVICHMIHLGFAKDASGQCLHDFASLLVQRGTCPNLDEALYVLWANFLLWAKSTGHVVNVKVFTTSTISWSSQSDYASVEETMKAKASELLLRFCCVYAIDLFERGVDTSEYSKLRAALAHMLLGFFHIIDNGAILLSCQEAVTACSFGMHYLRIYQCLANMAYVNLECKWKLRPKTHAFAHLCVELPSTLENPARQNLLWAEDAIGKAKHIAIHCHRTLAPLRVLERRFMHLSLHWRKHQTEWNAIMDG